MKIHRIQTGTFRCDDAFDLAVDGEALTFVAANAGGKTTMLTAVHTALTGTRSLNQGEGTASMGMVGSPSTTAGSRV